MEDHLVRHAAQEEYAPPKLRCRVVQVVGAPKPLEEYEAAQKLPYSMGDCACQVAILGGTTPRRTLAILDTGSHITMISEGLAKALGLEIRPDNRGQFTLADKSAVTPKGQCALKVQFGDQTLIQLDHVTVAEGAYH